MCVCVGGGGGGGGVWGPKKGLLRTGDKQYLITIGVD